jgi:hypothetical protein
MERSQALTADFPAEAALHCHPAQGCSRRLWAIGWPSADRTLTVAVIPSRPWQRQHTNAIKLPEPLNAGCDGGSWQCQTTVDLKLMKTGTTEGAKGMVTAMVWCCVVLSPAATPAMVLVVGTAAGELVIFEADGLTCVACQLIENMAIRRVSVRGADGADGGEICCLLERGVFVRIAAAEICRVVSVRLAGGAAPKYALRRPVCTLFTQVFMLGLGGAHRYGGIDPPDGDATLPLEHSKWRLDGQVWRKMSNAASQRKSFSLLAPDAL